MKLSALLFSLIFSCGVFAKELTIATGPNFQKEQLEVVFAPLSKRLKAFTGYELKVVSSLNYYFYWKDATRKMPDLSFDDPHIASYRIKHQGYTPLAKTIEPTVFHLITAKNSLPGSDKMEALRSQKLITMQHPSIASILFENWFSGSVILPTRLIADYAWSDCIDSLNSGESQAAIVPDWVLANHSEYISIKESMPYLGMSILASPSLDAEATEAIKQILLMIPENSEILSKINTKKLVDVSAEDYTDYFELIPTQYLRTSAVAKN